MLSERIKSLQMKQLNYIAAPQYATIEVSTHCNNKCIFCSHSKMTRPKQFMSFQKGKRYLSQLAEAGVETLGFNGCGEPMLNLELAEFINYAKKLNFKYIYLTSNGSVTNDALYKNILDAGLSSLKFSINGTNPISYSHAHGIDKKFFHEVITRINSLYKYKEKNNLNCKIYVSCVSSEKNIEPLKKLLQIDEVVHYPIGNQSGQSNLDSPMNKKEFCNFPFKRTQITVEGYVSACCTDFQNFLIMGNLNSDSFESIWNGKNYQELRNKILKKDLNGLLCHSCFENHYHPATPTMPQYAYLPQLH